jgi:serine/threonine-protein kinase
MRPGDLLDGKYRIGNVIGAGGMGVVVSATHLELDAPVAVKFLSAAAMDVEGAVERFMREARAAARMRSEHGVRVQDVGRLESGIPFMVMEFLQGVDFGALTRDRKRLDCQTIVDYVLQACEAVEEAHSLGIVHRDLKPSNLFLTSRPNGEPWVKVLDFGISKIGVVCADHGSLTQTNDVVGTPLYMSPEQIRCARDVDLRSDIWSLGVILYELLAGRVPFSAKNVPAQCALVLEEEPQPLGELRPDAPEELCRVVEYCLRKDPVDRCPNIEQLRKGLAPFATGGQPPPIGANSVLSTLASQALPGGKPPSVGFALRPPLIAAAVVVALGLAVWVKGWSESTPPRASYAQPVAVASPFNAPESTTVPALSASETIALDRERTASDTAPVPVALDASSPARTAPTPAHSPPIGRDNASSDAASSTASAAGPAPPKARNVLEAEGLPGDRK